MSKWKVKQYLSEGVSGGDDYDFFCDGDYSYSLSGNRKLLLGAAKAITDYFSKQDKKKPAKKGKKK